VKFTRREALTGAVAAALGGAGVYELVDRLGGSSAAPKRAAGSTLPPEQHVLDGLAVVQDNGVEVVVPPLHHQLVTAKVRGGDLRSAKGDLEEALQTLERRYDPTPAGLGVTVAWGLPYFRDHVPAAWAKHAPRDRRARSLALLDARRFPSDPHDTILEQNDVAVLLRSDSSDHLADAAKTLFHDLRVFDVTSIRKGFVGGGFEGRRSLPKKVALAAGVPGAELIPETAQLFLGFTSTQRAGLGPRRIANFETLGYVDLGPGDYFRHGTAMHVSHVFEDLEAWYLNFDFTERVDTAFRPGMSVPQDTQTVRQGPHDVSTDARVKRQFRDTGRIGHSASIQTTSRLFRDHVAADGTVYPKGTAIPIRADFNTLDNPFTYSAHPVRDGMEAAPAAGVHFVVFNPTSDDFHRNRLAMDGVLPDGTRLPLPARARGQGFNAVLRTTHRQNFLVPPRVHRSFPLAEL
jgi:hypothetical protein